jgi:hypothetical protein
MYVPIVHDHEYVFVAGTGGYVDSAGQIAVQPPISGDCKGDWIGREGGGGVLDRVTGPRAEEGGGGGEMSPSSSESNSVSSSETREGGGGGRPGPSRRGR